MKIKFVLEKYNNKNLDSCPVVDAGIFVKETCDVTMKDSDLLEEVMQVLSDAHLIFHVSRTKLLFSTCLLLLNLNSV